MHNIFTPKVASPSDPLAETTDLPALTLMAPEISVDVPRGRSERLLGALRSNNLNGHLDRMFVETAGFLLDLYDEVREGNPQALVAVASRLLGDAGSGALQLPSGSDPESLATARMPLLCAALVLSICSRAGKGGDKGAPRVTSEIVDGFYWDIVPLLQYAVTRFGCVGAELGSCREVAELQGAIVFVAHGLGSDIWRLGAEPRQAAFHELARLWINEPGLSTQALSFRWSLASSLKLIDSRARSDLRNVLSLGCCLGPATEIEERFSWPGKGKAFVHLPQDVVLEVAGQFLCRDDAMGFRARSCGPTSDSNQWLDVLSAVANMPLPPGVWPNQGAILAERLIDLLEHGLPLQRALEFERTFLGVESLLGRAAIERVRERLNCWHPPLSRSLKQGNFGALVELASRKGDGGEQVVVVSRNSPHLDALRREVIGGIGTLAISAAGMLREGHWDNFVHELDFLAQLAVLSSAHNGGAFRLGLWDKYWPGGPRHKVRVLLGQLEAITSQYLAASAPRVPICRSGESLLTRALRVGATLSGCFDISKPCPVPE